ncbi:porin family protein [Pedobacter sp. L105]|uniref:porin family protein n=1 Tax=Pedobacter sp. L105 TaxID=1641871 RepID=UPI00131BE59E|nr:porin family protein [Pedobacter sp. L105]
MKKLYIGLLLSILTTTAFAQFGAGPDYGFRLGLMANPTIGWVKPESGTSNGANLGFSYGLMADFNFTRNYSFSTGLSITTINGKSTEINPSPFYDAVTYPNPTPYDLKYMLQYIEIPLTLKLKTEKIGLIKWYGQFGLSNGFLTSAKEDVSVNEKSIVQDAHVTKNINFYRAGLIIGGGLEYDVARSTSVTTGLTYNNGFTNISSNSNSSVRNHYIAINFGVFF